MTQSPSLQGRLSLVDIGIMSSKPGFTPLHQILKNELVGLAKGKFATTWNIESRWHELVGKVVAEQSNVLFVKNGILHVGVKNSVWMHELGFMKAKILQEIQSQLPTAPVTDIKFKML